MTLALSNRVRCIRAVPGQRAADQKAELHPAPLQALLHLRPLRTSDKTGHRLPLHNSNKKPCPFLRDPLYPNSAGFASHLQGFTVIDPSR